jgi:hypothetical protein
LATARASNSDFATARALQQQARKLATAISQQPATQQQEGPVSLSPLVVEWCEDATRDEGQQQQEMKDNCWHGVILARGNISSYHVYIIHSCHHLYLSLDIASLDSIQVRWFIYSLVINVNTLITEA